MRETGSNLKRKVMNNKVGFRVTDIKAKHIKGIMDALEEATKEQGLGTQHAIYIAMHFGFKEAITAMGRKKGVKAMRDMLALAEDIVTMEHDDCL
jgi:hypothetical protein